MNRPRSAGDMERKHSTLEWLQLLGALSLICFCTTVLAPRAAAATESLPTQLLLCAAMGATLTASLPVVVRYFINR